MASTFTAPVSVAGIRGTVAQPGLPPSGTSPSRASHPPSLPSLARPRPPQPFLPPVQSPSQAHTPAPNPSRAGPPHAGPGPPGLSRTPAPLGADAEARFTACGAGGTASRDGPHRDAGPQATGGAAAILLCCASCREEPLGVGGACSRHAPGTELVGGAGMTSRHSCRLWASSASDARPPCTKLAGCGQPPGHRVCEGRLPGQPFLSPRCPQHSHLEWWKAGLELPCLEAAYPVPDYFGGKFGNLSSRTWLRVLGLQLPSS